MSWIQYTILDLKLKYSLEWSALEKCNIKDCTDGTEKAFDVNILLHEKRTMLKEIPFGLISELFNT